MRKAAVVILIALPVFAQGPPRRPTRGTSFADSAENSIKQASEQLANIKRLCERDIAVLQHLRAADNALTDPSQPNNAMQKAWDEVEAAKGLQPDMLVYQGIGNVEKTLASAKLSPPTADFGRIRSQLRTDALGPASRAAIRDASSVQDEILAWLRVQQLIGDYVRTMSEISGQALKASEQ